jgi:hypothetical protein
MTTHSRTGRPQSRVRRAAIVVAAATIPVLISVPLVRADPQPDSPDVARPGQVDRLRGADGRLAFSSYLGGQEWDEATGVAADRDGNMLVAGFTLSKDFPVRGSGTRGHAAIVDAFVTKVGPDSRIVWSTQLGGVDMDAATALTVDPDGNVYVVGRTGSPDFPTAGGLRHRLNGRSCTGEPCHDAFVTKLSSSGRIVWSTYLGGSRNEEALGVAVGQDRSVYVTGVTDSSDFPVRSAFQGTFQSPPCKGDLPCPYDAFVTKVAAGGDRLVYSTYLGGNAGDIARGIDVDPDGSAYVVGSTSSPDFPKLNPFQATLLGKHCGPPPGEACRQGFLTKLSPSGRSAAYSTYLGGREHDDANGVAVDRERQAHVTGVTQSPDFPTRNAFQAAPDNRGCTSEQPKELCGDGFVTKFEANGQKVVYSTYLGGRAEDQGLNIDVTQEGEALIAGRTDSKNFPVTSGAAQPEFGGYIDGFATKFRHNGKPLWSTFVGGKDADRGTGISADRHGSAHIAGRTLSPDFPTSRPFQPELKDADYDAFVSIIN